MTGSARRSRSRARCTPRGCGRAGARAGRSRGPAASYSSRCQPTPTPRSRRPPDKTSSVAAVLASTTGRRSAASRMPVARRTRSVDSRDHAQGRHRLEPVPVGTGRLPPAALPADARVAVGVELLAEHDVVRDDEPVDADAVVEPRGLEHRRSSRSARRPRTRRARPTAVAAGSRRARARRGARR